MEIQLKSNFASPFPSNLHFYIFVQSELIQYRKWGVQYKKFIKKNLIIYLTLYIKLEEKRVWMILYFWAIFCVIKNNSNL